VRPDELLAGARDAMAARTVYGEAVERDGVTVVPAAAVLGGGGGGGDADGSGGGGFGLRARPVGAWVIRRDDVRWKPVRDPARVELGWQLVAALALLVLGSVLRRRR
jgi:uncharacterized spore protein YtfJ